MQLPKHLFAGLSPSHSQSALLSSALAFLPRRAQCSSVFIPADSCTQCTQTLCGCIVDLGKGSLWYQRPSFLHSLLLFFCRGGKIFSLFFQLRLYADVLCVICSVFSLGWCLNIFLLCKNAVSKKSNKLSLLLSIEDWRWWIFVARYVQLAPLQL